MTDATTDPKTLGQPDLIARIAEQTGLPKTAVADVLRAHGEQIAQALTEYERIRLGLGTFSLRATKPRQGRIAGRAYAKPAGVRVVFNPSKALKDALNTP